MEFEPRPLQYRCSALPVELYTWVHGKCVDTGSNTSHVFITSYIHIDQLASLKMLFVQVVFSHV